MKFVTVLVDHCKGGGVVSEQGIYMYIWDITASL